MSGTPRRYGTVSRTPVPDWPTCRHHLRVRIKELRPSMSDWLEDFLTQDSCAEGLKPITLPRALCKILSLDPNGSDGLLLDVVEACYHASKFNDRFKVQRDRNRDILKELPTVEQAITTLRSFLSRYPDIGSWMLGGAYLHWKQSHKPRKVQFLGIQDTRATLAELQEDFLGSWAKTLKAPIPSLKCGPFLYRFQSGPLLYQKALDEQDTPPLDPALNGLVFNLAFLFRRATSKETFFWATGSPMPTNGKPHYPLVTLLTVCALPDRCHLTASIVKDRITYLVKKRVSLASWPTE